MTNHVRNLILNLDGVGFLPGEGEEYVPPEYRAIALPGPLQRVRQVLFGRAPDRRTLLYRTRQFLALLHACALEEFVAADDPRLTYLPLDRGGLELRPGTDVATLEGTTPLHLGGDQPGEDSLGRTHFPWLVVAGGSGDQLLVSLRSGPAVMVPLVFTAGLSAPVALSGTSLTVQVPESVVAGDAWTIDHRAVPAADLGELAARLDRAGDETLVALFGVSRDEPWATWRNLWAADATLAYRLGAAVLALAARTDEVKAGLQPIS